MSGISFLPNAFGDMREDVNMLWLQNRSDSNVGDLRQDAWRARNETQDFQERMSNTAYQRAMADMKAAGLNPMLAAKQGGADTPSGSAAVAGGGGMAHSGRSGQNALALSQMELNSAAVSRTHAETEKIGAETEEVRRRTPTHDTSIAKMNQEIEESAARIRESISRISLQGQEEATSAANAGRLMQETRNLLEEIPRIRALVKSLNAQAGLSTAHMVESGDRGGEIRQRTRADLPALEAALKVLEAKRVELSVPGAAMRAAADSSFLGAWRAALRALSGQRD